MALIICKKCGRQISDKAKICPGCGCKITADIQQNDEQLIEKSTVSNQSDAKLINIDDTKTDDKKKRNIMIIAGFVVAMIIVVFVFMIKGVVKDDSIDDSIKEADQKTASEEQEDTQETEETNIKITWADGQAPTEVGDTNSIAKIIDSRIVDSSYGFLLVMDLEYCNNTDEAKNLINDWNCQINPYQNGIALETPVVTSEEGKFDTTEAFTNVKKEGTIKTQLAWVLKDTVSSIEVDFGLDENYRPDYSKSINLSGGKDIEGKAETEKELAKSDYTITWSNDPPEVIGDDNEQAIIKNTAIIDSANYGTILVMDIDFINNMSEARNLINDPKCNIVPYQNGIELESPGITTDTGVFDYSDSFVSVKNGGKISTQLVWVLKDSENPIEIEFGRDEYYQPIYTETLNFKK